MLIPLDAISVRDLLPIGAKDNYYGIQNQIKKLHHSKYHHVKNPCIFARKPNNHSTRLQNHHVKILWEMIKLWLMSSISIYVDVMGHESI